VSDFGGSAKWVYCVKKRLVMCGRFAGATSSGRSGGPDSGETAAPTQGGLYCGDAGLIGCLDISLVRFIGIVECLDVLPSDCLVFIMQVYLFLNI